MFFNNAPFAESGLPPRGPAYASPRFSIVLLLLLTALAPRLSAQVVFVGYTETNLADTTVGQDLWRYTYVVSGLTLEANQGFSVFFDENSYASLQSPPLAVNPDWSIISVQPDLNLSSDGFYDAFALTASPSFVGTFAVDFVWQGTGTPGAQRYTVYDTDFSTLVTGTTTHTNGRIVNFSIRSTAGSADRTLIVGFVVGGGGKPLLVRAIGPTLADFSVPNALGDSQLVLFDAANAEIARNDNWGAALNFAELKAVSNAVFAFPIADASLDAAYYATVPSGLYSVHCTGVGGTTGVALVEMYDTTPETAARLINVSARTEVGIGADILIAGFVITGDSPRTVLIRGVGPRLAFYGVTGVLADPELTIFQKQGNADVEIATNDDWSSGANVDVVAAVAASVSAFPLPDGSKDAALVMTLPPGLYTAHVKGKNNTTGIALAEVYDVP